MRSGKNKDMSRKRVRPDMRAVLGSWLKSDIAWCVYRILLVYAALAVCRLVFYIYNYDTVGGVSWSELGPLAKGALRFDTISVLYANILFILLSLFPLRLRAKKWWRAVTFGSYMLPNTLTVALNLADCVYFGYTSKRISAEEIFFAGNDNTALLMGKFMLENWYLVLVGIALVWGLWIAYRRKAVPRTPVRNPFVYYGAGLLVLAAALALSVGAIRGGFTRTTRPTTLSNALSYTRSPDKANLVLSNPFCVVRTIGNKGIAYEEYFGEEELDSLYTPYHYPDGITPAFEGQKNIIFFILESFSAEHSAYLKPHLHDGGEGYTPFLDSLMREGFTFRQAYSNGYKSIEAMSSAFSSIPSFKKTFVLLPYALGENRALPVMLGEKGYSTAFFCGSPHGSMGFDSYAVSIGIERLFAQEDYEKRHGKGDFDGSWGIWDEPFLQYMGEELGELPQPFFSTVFSVSSHHPFAVPAIYADSLPEGPQKINKTVAYTDMAIRRFFERYGEQEWFRNSMFVFMADHVSSGTVAPETNTTLGSYEIVQFIYTPDGSVRGDYTPPAMQIDLMPTILGLTGNSEPYFAFGRDVLNEPERPAVVFNYSTRSLIFFIANDDYMVQFDEHEIINAYGREDVFNEDPLPPPYPAEAAALAEHLKAVIQQYYTHLKRQQYIAPPRGQD